MKLHRSKIMLQAGIKRYVSISLILLLTEITKSYIINNKPTVGLLKRKYAQSCKRR
jgi:hypothetical protein